MKKYLTDVIDEEGIKSSLTSQINDRELFMKGINYSYYYEEVEEL